MCQHTSGAKQREVLLWDGRRAWVDPCIALLVEGINSAGLPTVASCCGHGCQPPRVDLADGRVVMIVDQATADEIAQRYAPITGEGDRTRFDAVTREVG